MSPTIIDRKRKRNGGFLSCKSKRRRVSPERKTKRNNIAESNSVNQTKWDWREGRRIVELGFLVDQLKEGCTECKEELNLTKIVEETIHGLGSILYIQCVECLQVNAIKTGKTHRSPQKKNVGRPIWDINTKAATGW